MESIYKKAEEELGYPVSQTTKEYLNALSRQKQILRQPFIDSGGNFDEVAYLKAAITKKKDCFVNNVRKQLQNTYM